MLPSPSKLENASTVGDVFCSFSSKTLLRRQDQRLRSDAWRSVSHWSVVSGLYRAYSGPWPIGLALMVLIARNSNSLLVTRRNPQCIVKTVSGQTVRDIDQGPVSHHAAPLGSNSILPASLFDRIDKDIIIIPSGFPHRISSQPIVFDERPLRFERPRVVIRNHHLRGDVVNIRLI